MHAAAAMVNAASFGFAVVLSGHVVLRRARSPLAWTVVALLAGIALWTGGGAWRHLAQTRPELLVAFGVMFFGVCAVPPLWLLLAARLARWPFVEERPERLTALAAPGLFFYAAFLTNERHGAFAHIELGSFAYGPLFWGMVAWGYLCVLSGVVLFLHRARAMAFQQERVRAVLLAVAAFVPLTASVSYLGGILPWTFDPTPASLGISTALLFPLVFRMSLLEDLPLMRRDVIEHLDDGVVIADSEGAILDANPTALALLGASARALRGERLGAALERLVVADDRAALRAMLLEASGTRAPVQVTAPAGRKLRLHSARVVGRGTKPAGRFVVIHDCTEELRRERMLRRAQKLESLGLLAAGIAHEVNNPLAFVRANLGQLAAAAERAGALCGKLPAQDAAELALVPELVAESIEGVERITRIVASMRGLAREGREEALGPVDCHRALDDALKLAQLGPEVRVERDLDPELPPVRGSKDGLAQVFLNLLVNSRQALAQRGGGCIRMASRHVAGAVEVVIEDDGPGIDEALQERIFDPFFTTKGPDEGTGLGLAIAFAIVRAHRGTLAVQSSPGRGTRATVRLPA